MTYPDSDCCPNRPGADPGCDDGWCCTHETTHEETAVSDLVTFVRARLDEDEQVAHAASLANPGPAARHWAAEEVDDRDPTTGLWGKAWGVLPERVRGPVLARTIDITPTVSAHIARHDPARVLREVAYKRRVVEKHQPRMLVDPNGKERADWPERECRECGDSWMGTQTWERGEDFVPPEPEYCDELLHLVAVYADHPDYQAEWAP